MNDYSLQHLGSNCGSAVNHGASEVQWAPKSTRPHLSPCVNSEPCPVDNRLNDFSHIFGY